MSEEEILAYESIKKAAQEYRKHEQERNLTDEDIKIKCLLKKPFGCVLTKQGFAPIYLEEKDVQKIISDVLIKDSAQEDLSHKIYSKGYYSLDQKQKNRIKYLIDKQASF